MMKFITMCVGMAFGWALIGGSGLNGEAWFALPKAFSDFTNSILILVSATKLVEKTVDLLRKHFFSPGQQN